jgi:hypothetical protein
VAICPFAVVKLLHPENDPGGEPTIEPTQLTLHTAVSKAASLYGYFSRADVKVESTFYIPEDGTLEQYMDTCRQADAQFDGNLHGNSVETWDDGDPNNTPLNDRQIATYLKLARWENETHGIPLHICNGPQEPGQGYHSLFPEWAKDGHTCPNALRIAQFNDVILPGLAAPPPKPASTEIDMLVLIHAGGKYLVLGDHITPLDHEPDARIIQQPVTARQWDLFVRTYGQPVT